MLEDKSETVIKVDNVAALEEEKFLGSEFNQDFSYQFSNNKINKF